MSRSTEGLLAILAAGVLWGTTYPLVKVALREATAIDIAFYRAVFAALILTVYAFPSFRRIRPTRREMAQLLLQSILGVSALWIFMNLAVQFATATQAALLVALYPLLLALLAPWLLGESLQIRNVGAVALGVLGAYLMIGNGQLTTPFLAATLAGDLSALAAALAYAFYLALTRRFYAHSRLSPTYVTWQQFLLAVPPLAAAFVLTGATFTPVQASLPTIVSLLWLGTAPSALGFLLINRGMRTVSASHAAAGLLVFPPVAAILSYVLLGETLTVFRGIGAACILAGIALVRRSSPGKRYN